MRLEEISRALSQCDHEWRREKCRSHHNVGLITWLIFNLTHVFNMCYIVLHQFQMFRGMSCCEKRDNFFRMAEEFRVGNLSELG